MSDIPEVEPARTWRSARPSEAPASRPLTRAELRRRAQEVSSEGSSVFPPPRVAAEPTPAPAVGSRRARRVPFDARVGVTVPVAAERTIDVAHLAELDSAALALPTVEAVEEPVVLDVPRAAKAADAPIALAAAAVDEQLAVADAAHHAADARAQAVLDEFEAAARLFSFTGETPVQVAGGALGDGAVGAQHPSDHAGRRRFFSFKRVATASFSVGVFGVVGLLAVGMTTPVGAVAAAQGVDAASTNVPVASDVSVDVGQIQAYVAPADVRVRAIERTDDFQATSLAQIAADSGISNFSSFFTNDPTAAVQWPFAIGVPITYGFGMRSGSMHEGADFVPGAGAPVQAIADGTVRIATESGGAYGATVVIDHVIDGERISSRSAHMQYGSLQVKAGDVVTVGTVIGKTGNTGRSFGAHTHFEILADGTTAIDPIPWLREHAGG